MVNVGFEHKEYRAHYKQVKVVNDVFNGTDFISSYIKQFPQEVESSFEERKSNVALKNFVKRATEAFVGMIFRKPISTSGYSEKINEILSKIDTEVSLNQFARTLSTNLILDGITYLMADAPRDGGDPYLVNLRRASVINWRKNDTGNFTLVVIREMVDDIIDEFSSEEVEQYRVIKDDGTVTLYRVSDGEYYVYDSFNTDLDYVPIVELNLSKIPTLYDIALLNLKHANRTSAKDRYLDMAACPVPVIWGADIDDESGEPSTARPALVIGVDEAFIFNGTKDECDFQWRELQGTSINELQKDLLVIEKDITSGVIRASQSDSQTIKTATQAYYESAEASNRVTVIANIVEYALNKSVDMLIDFVGEPIPTLGIITINKDYNAIASDSGEVRLLWEMYLGGALSIETLYSALEQYEMISVGNPSDEVKRVEADTFVPKSKIPPKAMVKSMDNTTAPQIT
jgi:hypothetical protein